LKIIALELLQIVHDFSERLHAVSDHDFLAKPNAHKWSKPEILGHLIDSGHNNLRRFICGQYENQPPHIIYNQDFWVAANNYQASKKDDVITLWRLINERIYTVLITMPEEKYLRECNTGRHTNELHSLEFLAIDYVRHLKHHLNQILPGSFDVVYS
jgi:hypothetical protein